MNYKLWARWGSRLENAAACAARLARMFEGLSGIHPAFAHWNGQANSRVAANKPFCTMPPNIEELTRIFEKNLTHKDDPPDPWPEMGYALGMWNGRDGACGVSLSLRAGAYNDPFEPNRIFMQLHATQPGNEDFINAKVLARVLVVIATAWGASWGVIETWDYKGQRRDANGHLLHPWGGWITYLSAPYAGRIASLPAAARSEPVAGGGRVIVATQKPFTVANPAHVAALDAIQQALAPIQR